MCSIGEDDFGDDGGIHAMQKEEPTDVSTNDISLGICRKCNSSEAVVKLNFREAECENCFFLYVRHKFRATLGSSKILPKNSDVLVVCDGSAQSVTLIDMLEYAQSQDNFKRLHCNIRVLYVDERNLQKSSIDDMKNMEILKEIFAKIQLPKYWVNIAAQTKIIQINDEFLLSNQQSSCDEEKQFLKNFHSIKTLTSKQDYLFRCRREIWKAVARNFQQKFIFSPEICPDLATILLNDMSLGRGSSAALDVSLLDDRDEDITIVRPLKDLNETEILNYVRLRNLKFIVATSTLFGEDFGAHASIQNLTKDFVKNLQKNYASTVSTIFKTGSKIGIKGNEQKCHKNRKRNENSDLDDLKTLSIDEPYPAFCVFCHAALDFRNSTTLHAIEFSKVVSESCCEDLSNMCRLEEKATINLIGETLDHRNLRKELCHGCRNIFHDLNNEETAMIFS